MILSKKVWFLYASMAMFMFAHLFHVRYSQNTSFSVKRAHILKKRVKRMKKKVCMTCREKNRLRDKLDQQLDEIDLIKDRIAKLEGVLDLSVSQALNPRYEVELYDFLFAKEPGTDLQFENLQTYPDLLGDFERLSLSMEIRGKFSELASWMHRVDSSKLPVRLTGFNMTRMDSGKDPSMILEVGLEAVLHKDGKARFYHPKSKKTGSSSSASPFMNSNSKESLVR